MYNVATNLLNEGKRSKKRNNNRSLEPFITSFDKKLRLHAWRDCCNESFDINEWLLDSYFSLTHELINSLFLLIIIHLFLFLLLSFLLLLFPLLLLITIIICCLRSICSSFVLHVVILIHTIASIHHLVLHSKFDMILPITRNKKWEEKI